MATATAGCPSAWGDGTSARGNIAFYLVLFLLCVLTVAGFLPHPALLAVVGILLLWRNRGLFVRIDYSLILTFVFFLSLWAI